MSDQLFEDHEASCLAATFLAAGYYPTTPGAFFEPFFSQQPFAFPFFLASLILFLRGRYFQSSLLVGIMMNIHGIHAFHL